jgi:hypothetical protein
MGTKFQWMSRDMLPGTGDNTNGMHNRVYPYIINAS